MSASRQSYVQRGAAVKASLRVTEQLEFEASPIPTGPRLREEPSARRSSPDSRQARHPWQRQYLPRNPLPPNNPEWRAEMDSVEVYRQKSEHVKDKRVLSFVDNANLIKQIIYMIMETSAHYNWQNPKKVADRGNIEGIGKEVYWKTGVLVSAEEVLRTWTNGRKWVRRGVKEFVMKGLNEDEVEAEFEKKKAYPYLRFARLLFVDYEKELRKKYAGEKADDELIRQREEEDDIYFEGVYRSDHQMTFASVKDEIRKNGEWRSDDAEDFEVDNPLPDSDPIPAPPPPPTDSSRRRPAPSDEPIEASPNKLRANAPPPPAVAPEDAPNNFRAPPTPVRASVAPDANHQDAALPARQVAQSGAQEGFASGFTPSGSESPIPDASHPKETKPTALFVHHPVVEQASWGPLVNPLTPTGVYADVSQHGDGRSQSDAISETCRLLTNRLMFYVTNTTYQNKLAEMIRIMADTLEQDGKMETPEVLYECMLKHRNNEKNRKTN